MSSKTDADNVSRSSDCSIAVDVPTIPPEAIEFSNAVATLAEQNGIQSFTMEIRVDTGRGTRFWCSDDSREIQERMTVNFSAKDGRQMPCRNLSISFGVDVHVKIDEHHKSSN